MKDKLQQFEMKEPEVVFSWSDQETEARGWVVINSLRNGAAAGGTRMRKGLNKREVVSLAKTMEVKFTVAGPPIGGGKSGIDFDPQDPRKAGVLNRWYKAIKPLLKSYYGTGGDLNVDEINEVIPITKKCGVLFPLEGVVKGHFQSEKQGCLKKINQLELGVDKPAKNKDFTPVCDTYKIGDLATGYGVGESIKHFYAIYGGSLKNKRAIIQGWGNVGSAAAYYLAKNEAKVVGIIDKRGGLINTEGFTFKEITNLFLNKKKNKLSAKNMLSFEEVNDRIWKMGAEVFIPAAASRLVTKEQVESMILGGLEVISSGANVPFADEEIFYGPTAEYADSKTTVLPDFISNCGMARTFSYLMEEQIKITDEAIFNSISSCIKEAVQAVYNKNKDKKYFTKTALDLALNQLL